VLLLIPFHAAAVFYTGDSVSSIVVNPKRVQALAGRGSVPVSMAHAVVVLSLGWLHCLLRTPLQLRSPDALPAGTPAARLLFPLLLHSVALVPPQVYLHELTGHGIEPELPAVLSPLFLIGNSASRVILSGPISGSVHIYILVSRSSAFRAVRRAALIAAMRLSLLIVPGQVSWSSLLPLGSAADAVRKPCCVRVGRASRTFIDDWPI